MAQGPVGFTEEGLALLEGLEANNERDWFRARKEAFDERLLQPFAALLERLTVRLADAPVPLSGSASTIFRMNRDVRFSKDKTPYKTAVSGMLTPSGTKAPSGGVLYLQLGTDGGFVGAGFYMLSPAQLVPIRDAMVARAGDWDAVLEGLSAAGRGLSTDHALSAMPRGYAEHADHRHAASIRLKSLLVSERLARGDWLKGTVEEKAERLARDAMPLLSFQAPG